MKKKKNKYGIIPKVKPQPNKKINWLKKFINIGGSTTNLEND
jgi:hypothetical protein